MTKGRRHDLVSWVTVADTWGCLYGFRQAAEAAGVRRRCRLWLAPTTDIVLLVQEGVHPSWVRALSAGSRSCAGRHGEGFGVGQVRSKSNTAGLFVGDLDGSQRVRHGAGDCFREKSIMLDGEQYEGL